MTTKQLINCAAIFHFGLYGVVFIAGLLSNNTVPANYIHFVLAVSGLGFVGLTTNKSHLVNGLAFSAIVSSMLLYIASLIGAVVSAELLAVFAGYFFICLGVSVVNTAFLKTLNARTIKQG